MLSRIEEKFACGLYKSRSQLEMPFPVHAFGVQPSWKARAIGHFSAFPLLPLQQDSGVWAGCTQAYNEDECDCLVSWDEIIHQFHKIYIQCELWPQVKPVVSLCLAQVIRYES